jgi:hypothetical protein
MVDNDNAPDAGVPADPPPVIEYQAPTNTAPTPEPALSLDDYRRLLDRLDALEREKAERQRADAYAAGEVYVHPNTHVLVLANGDTMETANPSVTHVAIDDTVVPVIARHELKPAA